MILLAAIAAGAVIGLLGTWRANTTWQPPAFSRGWLVVVGFLPQFLAIYLPATRGLYSDALASFSLIISQVILLVFCLLNRRLPGIAILSLGLALNLAAILANRGFMPLPVETARQLLTPQRLSDFEVGQRLGTGSKDVLLPMSKIKLPWFADRFYPPKDFPYKFAFSLGDVLIAAGAFWLLAKPSSTAGGT
jgi:hypothetical protein